MSKDIVEIRIGYNKIKEEIEYIDSDFMKDADNYKDPVNYTAELIEMGLIKWVKDNIGLFCPECGIEMHEEWDFCPKCGWKTE